MDRIRPIGGMVDMAGGMDLMSDFRQTVSLFVVMSLTTTSVSVSFISIPATMLPSFIVTAMAE